MSEKEKYVRNKQDGTFSPLDEKGKVVVGLVLTSLPDNAECVGEYEYPSNEEEKEKPSPIDVELGFAPAPKEVERASVEEQRACAKQGSPTDAGGRAGLEPSSSESVQPRDQLGALQPYTTKIPMIEGAKIPAGSIERLEKIKAKRAEFIQQFGGKPLSVWEVDVTENKHVEDIKEKSQNKVWHERYDDVFDKRFYESAGVSGKTVRGERGGLSFFPYQVARKLLQFYSEKGDWILDPCAGHATRMTACFRLKRNYIGYDVSRWFMGHNRKLKDKLLGNALVKAETQIILREQTSEWLEEKSNTIDFIMSSPPYADTEFYGCVPEGTFVHTITGLKFIEDIKVGDDLVLTDRRRFAKVTRTTKRHYSGKLIKLKIQYCKEFFLFTPEHKILVWRTVPCRKNNKSWHSKPLGKGYCETCSKKELLWVPASKLKPYDFVVFPQLAIGYRKKIKMSDFLGEKDFELGVNYIRHKGQGGRYCEWEDEVALDGDFGRLVGYFTSDGSANFNRARNKRYPTSVSFCFDGSEGKNQMEYAEDVARLLKKFFLCYVYIKKKGNRITVCAKSTYAARFMRENFGVKKSKGLPNWFMRAPKECLKGYFKGYFRGDGYLSTNGISAGTISRKMAGQHQILLASLRIPSSFYISLNKDGWGENKLYCLSLPNIAYEFLFEKKLGGHRYRRWKDWGDFFLFPILNIEEIDYNGYLCNLETKDNSFVLPNMVVHNSEPEQLGWNKTYGEFLLGIRRMLTSCLRVLKPERFAAFVINDFRKDGKFYSYHADFIDLAKKVGWELWDFIILIQPSSIAAAFVNQLVEQKRMAKSHEYAVILRKPKLCKIHYHKSAYQPIVDHCSFCKDGLVYYEWESETHESGKCDKCGASSSRVIKR